MHEFLFILLPAHLIHNIQHDSEINSNIYIPPLQLGEIINSVPIFKQKQAPISTSCYTWKAPWGLHGFLRRQGTSFPAGLSVRLHQPSLSTRALKPCVPNMYIQLWDVWRIFTEVPNGKLGSRSKPQHLYRTVIWSHPHHWIALFNTLSCSK